MSLGLLNWAIIFLMIALVSALFGFGGIAGTSYVFAKWLFIVFIVLFIISLIAHFLRKV